MMNLFGQAALQTDTSLKYLSQIFGSVSGVLGQGGDITLLSTMFKVFNSMILVIAVLMLVYITIIGVIGTAHEGEFMGKKMNNIWIPIRAVLGIAMLVPTGAGYCGLQILMMWVIVQGVGAADTLWMTALSYINTVGSPYAQVSVPVVGASSEFTGLFSGLACDASLKKGNPKNLDNYQCTSPGGCGSAPAFDPTKSVYDLGSCGSLTYCNASATSQNNVDSSCTDPNSMKCFACNAQLTALAQIIPTLAGIAKSLVNADYSYRDFSDNSSTIANNSEWQWIYNYCASANIPKDQCCINSYGSGGICKAAPNAQALPAQYVSNDNNRSASSQAVKSVYWPFWPQLEPALGQGVDFIKTAVGYYQDLANGAVTNYMAAQGQNGNVSGNLALPTANSVINNAKANGWIFAGALYYQLASLNSNKLQDSTTSLTWTPSTISGGPRNNIDAAGYLAAAASGNTSTSTLSVPGASGLGASGQVLTNAFNATVTAGSGVNPLMMLQIFGTLMMMVAEIIFGIVVLAILVAGLTSGIDVFVLGTGVTNPLEPVAIMFTIFIVPAFWAGMAFLITTGALLAIYTPLLPYIYFTFGALAWMIATVEAMVAGPLVALGIISPSGQHEIMGKAEPALLMLFNLFLRPSLMIFGLMVAMLMAVVACRMVNETFAYVMINWAYPDPLTMIFMLVAYVSLILAVLNKCFAVINLIPQQVIRWIGGQGEAVETPTGEMKGAIDAAGGKAGGAVEGTGARGKEQGRAIQAAKDKQAKEERQQAKDKAARGVSGKSPE